MEYDYKKKFILPANGISVPGSEKKLRLVNKIKKSIAKFDLNPDTLDLQMPHHQQVSKTLVRIVNRLQFSKNK